MVTNLTIEQEDLKVLYVLTKYAYGNISFDAWCIKIRIAYLKFIEGKDNCKTYSQWVNGQIVYLNNLI
jgi:hypothetical protein